MIFKEHFFFGLLIAGLIAAYSVDAADTPCGTILTSNTGTIEFKPGEKYTPGEICVWTIRTYFTHITFSKSESHFETRGTTLSVHAFSRLNTDLEAHTAYLGQIDTQQNITLAGPIVVVLFQADTTSNNAGTGFILNYAVSGTFTSFDGESQVSSSSDAESYIHSSYPNDFSSFAFSGSNTGQSLSLHLPTYKTDGVFDEIFVYALESRQMTKLEKFYGGGVAGPYLTNELFVVLYSTDNSNGGGTGFEVYCERYPG